MTSTYALPLPPGSAPSPYQPGHRRFPSQFHDPSNPENGDRNSLFRAAVERTSANQQAHEHNQSHGNHSHNHNDNIKQDAPQSTKSNLSSLLSPSNSISIPAMPTTKGRPRGESDLGRPALNVRTTSSGAGALPATDEDGIQSASSPLPPSSSEIFSIETITGFLLPLPFLVFSLRKPLNISTHHHLNLQQELEEEVLNDGSFSSAPVPQGLLNIIDAFLLTSISLLLVALWGHMRQPKDANSRKRRNSVGSSKNKTGASSSLSSGAIKKVSLRIAYVGLPYLATMELGGARTGTILLAAAAAGLFSSSQKSENLSKITRIKSAIVNHKWTCGVFLLCLTQDLYARSPSTEVSSIFKGYLALAKYVFLLNPPFSNHSIASRPSPLRTRSATTTAWDVSPVAVKSRRLSLTSPLVSSSQDIRLTFVAGLILAIFAVLLSVNFAPTSLFSLTRLALDITSATSTACLLIFAQPSSLRTTSKLGLIVGLAACSLFGVVLDHSSIPHGMVLGVLSGMLYAAVQVDTRALLPHQKVEKHHSHDGHHHKQSHTNPSKFTQFLLDNTEDYALVHNILADKESRRIVYFMSINLAFMFIQTFYAIASGSLGLLSDSIHMFFDCVGLLAGLIASIMSKWPPNAKFPYGYSKVETLSGLGNGIFLMIISVEIIWESFERFVEGSELNRLKELMIVSVGGLVVNLIGLLFIGHAHHGHDHSHSHGGHDHGHDHHGHSHSNENMLGIYLHILADTMGSVAVIASTIATVYTGWSGWDPIASCIIAVLIIAASYPLVTGSARRLLLTVPSEIEYALRNTLQELSSMRGVSGYAVPRFWVDETGSMEAAHSHDHHHHHHHDEHSHSHSHSHPHSHNHTHGHAHTHTHTDTHTHPEHPKHKHTSSTSSTSSQSHTKTQVCSQRILGVIHIIATPLSSLEDVRNRVDAFLRERNIHAVVHVEREGVGRCWCGGIGREGSMSGNSNEKMMNGSGDLSRVRSPLI